MFICEGEKDADNVAALGFIATTNSGGALKWTGDLDRWFTGRKTVYILEDNDPPDDPKGQRHARQVADHLRDVVTDIFIVSFPELDARGDVSDWLDQGGTKEALLKRAKAGRRPSKGYTLVSADSLVPRA